MTRTSVIPEPEKFYFIDYKDPTDSAGSYFGIAKCVDIHTKDEHGTPIKPLYEFMHPDKDGKMVLSLYYAEEVLMDALKP